MKILVICTANQCRSPMAEALLRKRLEEVGMSPETASCGLLEPGSPATPEAVETMAAYGVDVSGHRSRRLAPQLVDQADLILAMTREHLREVTVGSPQAFPRTFTLKEFVRRGEAAGPIRPGDALPSYLTRISNGRRAADLMGTSPDDDIADPIGQPLHAYRVTAAELDDLCRRAAHLLAGGQGL